MKRIPELRFRSQNRRELDSIATTLLTEPQPTPEWLATGGVAARMRVFERIFEAPRRMGPFVDSLHKIPPFRALVRTLYAYEGRVERPDRNAFLTWIFDLSNGSAWEREPPFSRPPHSDDRSERGPHDSWSFG